MSRRPSRAMAGVTGDLLHRLLRRHQTTAGGLWLSSFWQQSLWFNLVGLTFVI